MSPSFWYPSGLSSSVHVLYMNYTGDLYSNANDVGDKLGVRPVINLKSNTVFAGGSTGEANFPYIVQ